MGVYSRYSQKSLPVWTLGFAQGVRSLKWSKYVSGMSYFSAEMSYLCFKKQLFHSKDKIYGFVTSTLCNCSLIQPGVQKCSLRIYNGSVMLCNHVIQMCSCGMWYRNVPFKELYGSSGEGVVAWHIPTAIQSEMQLIL